VRRKLLLLVNQSSLAVASTPTVWRSPFFLLLHMYEEDDGGYELVK
jgi:hypothetical protein